MTEAEEIVVVACGKCKIGSARRMWSPLHDVIQKHFERRGEPMPAPLCDKCQEIWQTERQLTARDEVRMDLLLWEKLSSGKISLHEFRDRVNDRRFYEQLLDRLAERKDRKPNSRVRF